MALLLDKQLKDEFVFFKELVGTSLTSLSLSLVELSERMLQTMDVVHG